MMNRYSTNTSVNNTQHLESILKHLETSLQTAKDAKTINEHGYPYSYGYLEATVSNAIFELKALLTQQ
jgi:hypothetical protein